MVGKLSTFKNLQSFYLSGIDESFDFETFENFILTKPNTKFTILFRDAFMEESYKEILDNFVYKILDETPNKIPLIQFPDQNQELHAKLLQLRFNCLNEKGPPPLPSNPPPRVLPPSPQNSLQRISSNLPSNPPPRISSPTPPNPTARIPSPLPPSPPPRLTPPLPPKPPPRTSSTSIPFL
uniref:Uncharacterized protein n=1 Tax=Panagrolaimus davidi TaxID=227884 RepID=A0A914PNR7_9BILA